MSLLLAQVRQRHADALTSSHRNLRWFLIGTTILILAIVAETIHAQQSQVSWANMALQINSAVSQMAQQLEATGFELQKAQARVKELEDKYEPKKKPEAPVK